MIGLTAVDTEKEKTEALIIPVCEDKDIYEHRAILTLIEKAKTMPEFKGEKGEELIFHQPKGFAADRVILAGLGKFEKIERESFRTAIGQAVKNSMSKKFSEISVAVPSEKKLQREMEDILEPMMEGACLANYVFDRYKEEKKLKPLKKIRFLLKAALVKKFNDLASRVLLICQGTHLAREWIGIPSNDKKPEDLAQNMIALAEKESLKITLLKEDALKAQGFGALLAVGAGSENKPCLLILEYRHKKAEKTVAFVGKGVTFDSGGLDLKTAAGMLTMKTDMSGAAAVAASLITVAKLKPDVNVIGVIPLAENMPSGKATRPSDIVRSYSGKTIEIGNTDAEGRLILADAMAYAVKQYKPDVLIDIATLTGACLVALGEKIAGVFSSDDALAQAILDSGNKTHERCWRLPLPEDYKEGLKSDVADTNNMSNLGGGGAITAALFLSEFAKNTRWAHLDIAGPARLGKAESYCGVGGTGFGVRLFCDILENI